ncbi:low affinity immunoglobulin gamma Fc region receptor II-like [Anarrhichthys ocellatus]|uniref:low affinity immunoglobulin gamma Fc region receptor II-like n=1 Tax=Anarrhichthys ocellatus TaxID=433405 RepID=UPI0012EEA8F4|nr:low affinity immunoglobulin gamma Fc region receptor II-like [Anarrhichthys ocellatus]
MEFTTLCIIVASLRLVPNRSQFFQYESVALSCVDSGHFSEWRVKRNTSMHKNEECMNWGKRNEFQSFIDDLHTLDTGVYWCEFGAGECSDAVNITVTAGFVILKSPVHPVQEGESVTLHCITKTTSSSNLTAEFYKDDVLVGSSSTGNVTIHSVLKSDEGLYKCHIFGAGESGDSWLAVREAGRPESSHLPLAPILLSVMAVCILLASVMLLCLWRNQKGQPCCAAGKDDSEVSYTDVNITKEVQPQEDIEMDLSSTFYSTIKPGAS